MLEINRHHRARIKRKRIKQLPPHMRTPRLIGKRINTPKPCSCFICGNARRYLGDTLQEKRMNAATDYQQATIASIRQHNRRLAECSDEHLSVLYHRWSNETMSAGWLCPTNSCIQAFCAWATTAPCDEEWTD